VEEKDRLIQGMAWGGGFRIIAAQTTLAVETARLRSDLSPVATAAIGRAMTGAVLLARLLDKQMRNQWVTLRFEGGGPLGAVIAEGTVSGNVRAFVSNPHVDDNQVNVGAAVGTRGNLTVVRGTPPEGVPYTSQVSLVSGEIAKDLAHYLAHSEQIASAVLLGVMIRPSGVDAAGGMIVQAFPHASESAIEAMEKRIREAPAFSTLLDRMSLEEAVQEVLRGSDYKLLDPSFNIPIQYSCSCTRERALKGFAYLNRSELSEIITEGGSEVVCQFCGQKYFFSGDDLLALSAPPDA
jgi:molecular chaperone Hsp33